MKILVLSSHTHSLFWFRMEMMSAFIKKGAEVIAIGNEPESLWKDKFHTKGIKYRSIPVSRNGLNILADIKTFKALKRIIQEEKPTKIFTYQAKTIVYGILASHIVDRDIQNFPLVAGLGSIFRGKGLKASVVKTILSVQYKIAFKFSDKVIFQNQDDRNELLRLGLLNESKTEIINGSGVNIEKFQEQAFPERKAVLYIGRLIRDKGVGEFLQLAERLKKRNTDIRCLLVGPYDTNPSALKPEELKPLIDSKIIEYFGEQSDVRPYLNQCTVYVLPSYHEGTPKTVLEAMATGRPIVTTDAPGCRETVEYGKNGYLVPVMDVDALETAVLKILNDPDLTATFGKCSRSIAENKYDVNKVNEKIISVLKL